MIETKLLPTTDVSLRSLIQTTGLIAVGGAAVSEDAIVTGAGILEGNDGCQGLEPKWLAVLDRPPAGPATGMREFVRAVALSDCSGLVLKNGTAGGEPLHDLLDEAHHCGLPVLALPRDVSVSAFLRQVHETVGVHDVSILMTALSLQSDLIGALSEREPEIELVAKIATRLGVSAALYDVRHSIIAAQGDAPMHLIAQSLQSASESEARVDVGRWRVSISPLVSDTPSRFLALAWPSTGEIEGSLVRATRVAVQQLLRAHSRTVASTRLQDQIQRGQALNELLDGVTESRLARMRDDLVLLHFPIDDIFQVHLVSGPATDSGTTLEPDPVLSIIQTIVTEHSVPALMGIHRDTYVVLHRASDVVTSALQDAISDRVHGASSAFRDLTSCPATLRQAQMSLATTERSGRFTPFHRVGFIDFMLGSIPEDVLRDRTLEVLGDLTGNEMMIETLVEYLRQDLDIQQTGRVMHLHPNSIRYRIARAEDQLGRSMSDPETITLLYLALRPSLLPYPGAEGRL